MKLERSIKYVNQYKCNDLRVSLQFQRAKTEQMVGDIILINSSLKEAKDERSVTT